MVEKKKQNNPNDRWSKLNYQNKIKLVNTVLFGYYLHRRTKTYENSYRTIFCILGYPLLNTSWADNSQVYKRTHHFHRPYIDKTQKKEKKSLHDLYDMTQ